jgi:hypothetical protein
MMFGKKHLKNSTETPVCQRVKTFFERYFHVKTHGDGRSKQYAVKAIRQPACPVRAKHDSGLLGGV